MLDPALNQNFTVIRAPKWAMGIITAALTAAIIGGFAYLFTMVAWTSKIEEKIAALEAAQLPQQMTTVLTDVASIKTDMETMKRAMERLDDKQNKIINQLGFGRKQEAKRESDRASF